jgi:hypothetical protein
VFGWFVLADHQRDSHGNEAERREQEQAADVATGLVPDPPIAKGPANPARLPIELITAIPAAAAASQF